MQRMYPKPYLDRVLKTEGEKSYYIVNSLGIISLFFVAMILAPLFHEFLHVMAFHILDYDCSLRINFDWSTGIYGKVNTISKLSLGEALIVLSAGVAGNLLVGGFLFVVCYYLRKQEKFIGLNFSLYIVLGFLSEPIFYFFEGRGDLVNILMLLDMSEFSFMLPSVGFILSILILLYISEHATLILNQRNSRWCR